MVIWAVDPSGDPGGGLAWWPERWVSGVALVAGQRGDPGGGSVWWPERQAAQWPGRWPVGLRGGLRGQRWRPGVSCGVIRSGQLIASAELLLWFVPVGQSGSAEPRALLAIARGQLIRVAILGVIWGHLTPSSVRCQAVCNQSGLEVGTSVVYWNTWW